MVAVTEATPSVCRGMDCRFCLAGGEVWWKGQIGGGLSHESEHDLAMMVGDFLENGSSGADSWCSSDSESSLSDLSHLAEKIPVSFLNTIPILNWNTSNLNSFSNCNLNQ